jgi:hypothetical protein
VFDPLSTSYSDPKRPELRALDRHETTRRFDITACISPNPRRLLIFGLYFAIPERLMPPATKAKECNSFP